MILTPHLVVAGGVKAIEFYKKALGVEAGRTMMAEDNARVMHCELHLDGGQKFFLCDDFPEYCSGTTRAAAVGTSTPVTMHLEVPNADEAMAKFAAAGGTITMPAQDMFWGDRYGQASDPFGHSWAFSHPLKK